MNFLTKSLLSSLIVLSMVSLAGCGNNETTNVPAGPIGNEETGNFADSPATVSNNATTDPYTGTNDSENHVGKHPISNDQTPAARAGDHAE